MLVRIVRNLTPEEIEERIKRFEIEVGMSFERFEEGFLKGRLDARREGVYFEWAELVDSYRGYVEEGTLDYSFEEIREFNPKQATLLSPKRIELLCVLASVRVESVSDLARRVRRNVKNVYEDLQVLSGFGFVKVSKRVGRAVVPETLVKEITFLIR